MSWSTRHRNGLKILVPLHPQCALALAEYQLFISCYNAFWLIASKQQLKKFSSLFNILLLLRVRIVHSNSSSPIAGHVSSVFAGNLHIIDGARCRAESAPVSISPHPHRHCWSFLFPHSSLFVFIAATSVLILFRVSDCGLSHRT